MNTDKDFENDEKDVSEIGDKEINKQDRDNLSELFRRYPIETYFWRNYHNKSRIKSLIIIFSVAIISVVVTLLICKFNF